MKQYPRPTNSPLPSPKVPSAVPQAVSDDPTSSLAFDWSDFLDFNLNENFTISFPQQEQPGTDQSQPSEVLSRVRKRDPRLVCSNFLAGRVPCACPEMDAMLAEEEKESEPQGKKRVRTTRVSDGGLLLRCQVMGCEADISQLKGYHKRHRVCLQCANASTVVLDGMNKRYCQQCGKFHILSDFDEDKRSCRRKLERHNRRRRKANDAKGDMEKETQQVILTDDVSGDDEAGKDDLSMSSQIEELELLPESDGHVLPELDVLPESAGHSSTPCSAPGSRSLQCNSRASFSVPGGKRKSNQKHSTPFCDNNTFSSLCPSDRISFKLYSWNPAEFPRRLRHQIFHWLANMPVELEAYVRPGCTILTVFISMPKPMWRKLLEEPAPRIKELITSPGSMLFGRGTMRVYLNDMVFHVTKDANSIIKVKVKSQAPKLHYIYPACFEAGRSMEFIACGSHLLQPKFRCLVSFAGRYLAYNISVSPIQCQKGESESSNHQLLKIFVPQTNMDQFGPAFIEVENQSGLSNFLPILIGDKEICKEMEILQQKFGLYHSSLEQLSRSRSACEHFAFTQTQFSEFVLDVAWSLRKPTPDEHLTSSHIQRFNHLLKFLIEKESSVILERLCCSLRSSFDNRDIDGLSAADMKLLQNNMKIAQNILSQKAREMDFSIMPTSDGRFYCQNLQNCDRLIVPATNQVIHKSSENIHGVGESCSPPIHEGAFVPLLNREVLMKINLQERPRKLYTSSVTTNFLSSRPLIMAMVAICACFGVCAVILHRRKVSQIATTIRFCLFDNT